MADNFKKLSDEEVDISADAVSSGEFADARISESSVTRHEDALSIDNGNIADGVLSTGKLQDAAGPSVIGKTGTGSGALTYVSLTGLDANVVSGTAGTANYIAIWNADGDLVSTQRIDADLIHDGSISNTEYGYLNGVTSAIQTQIDGKAATTTTTNAQSGTTYTLVLTDASKHVSMSNASANTLTVPSNASVAFATGTRILIQQLGAGSTTIAAGSGVTINAPASVALEIDEQYGSRGLLKTATNTWQLI